MTIGSFVLQTIFPAFLPPEHPHASNHNNNNENDDNVDAVNDDNNNNNTTTNTNTKDEIIEYYTCLGLNVKDRYKYDVVDIRKAYRKISLQCHPDKILQQTTNHHNNHTLTDIERTKMIKDMKQQYQSVQEAYDCLQDTNKRNMYHDYYCNVQRYRFVSNSQTFYNPMSIYENLQHSSCILRSRIVLAILLLLIFLLLQPILIAIKVNSITDTETTTTTETKNGSLEDTSWLLILIPYYIIHGMMISGFIVILCLSNFSLPVVFNTLEHISWMVGITILGLVWDDPKNETTTTTTTNWQQVAIPFYCVLAFRILSYLTYIKTIRMMQSKMISLQYLEKKLFQQQTISTTTTTTITDNATHSIEDLSEEEQKQIMKDYIIIQDTIDEILIEKLKQHYKEKNIGIKQKSSGRFTFHNPDTTSGTTGGGTTNPTNTLENEDEILEEQIRIETSTEYQASLLERNRAYRSIGTTLIYGVTFLLLVTNKLTIDSKIHDASWWLIFLPLFIYFGTPLLMNCCICVASSSGGNSSDDDEIIIITNNKESDVDTSNNNNGGEQDAKLYGGIPTSKLHIVSKDETTTGLNNKNNMTVEDGIALKNNTDDGDSDQKLSGDETPSFNTSRGGAPSKLMTESEREKLDEIEESSSTFLFEAVTTEGGKGGGDENGDADASSSTKPKSTEGTQNNDVPLEGEDSKKKKNKSNFFSASSTGSTEANDTSGGRSGAGSVNDDEAEAVRNRATSSVDNCQNIFYLIILCVLVGKLETDYNNFHDVDDEDANDNDNDNDYKDSYNAFWILFPIFVVTGIVLCCCCCLIYCTIGESPLYEDADSNTEIVDPTKTTTPDGVSIPPIIPLSINNNQETQSGDQKNDTTTTALSNVPGMEEGSTTMDLETGHTTDTNTPVVVVAAAAMDDID